jgi:hypothetical protein
MDHDMHTLQAGSSSRVGILMAYPDAYLKQGEVCCIQTDCALPSYSGLCLVDLAGRMAIMFTTPGPEGRDWDLVQWGSTLSSTEITKFMERK